jgi:superfamily II DNA/RNA helicase
LILGAETGSGKTLAYLLPALDWLLTRPVDQSQRRYPRVLVLQPNRELCAQLESVLASLIGASGSRDLPTTESDAELGESTRLHYGSLTGTALFPPSSCTGGVCDLLITTPGCLEHNLPFVDLARTRAKAIKRARALLEQRHIEEEYDEDDDDEMSHSQQSRRHPRRLPEIIDTPSSSPDVLSSSRAFDALSFVSSCRIVVLDEADLLLEGGESTRVKRFLSEVFLRFEPPPGLEPLTASERRNRWRRERRKEDPRRVRQAESEAADEFEAVQRVRAEPPFGRPRQFVFAAATLANISPLTSFQYLLNLFTPRDEQPPEAVSGPRSFSDEDLPPGAQIRLRITQNMHHLSPQLSQPGVVQWERVGPLQREEAAGGWDASRIDFARLDALDAAREGRVPGDGMEEDQEEAETRQLMMAEDMARSARSNRRVLGGGGADKRGGTKNFPSRKDLADEKDAVAGGMDVQQPRSGKAASPPERFTSTTDLDKVRATVRFLNAHTATALASSAASSPPAKSLLFVSTTARLSTLLSHLRSLQAGPRATVSAEDLAAGRVLSPHVQLLPYHAELKADERARTMQLFNSRAPAAAAAAAAAGTSPQQAAPVTHQVLLSTSLAARGLDFEHAAPGPSARCALKSLAAGSGPDSQYAGFECLVQFDLATNVVDYIHRCGRMFRHRPAPVGGDESAEAAAQRDQSLASDSAAPAQLLHLYSAADELLVSHLRSADASPASGTFIADSAFSRNRRLRVKAKKAERAAREIQQQEAEDTRG